MLKFALPFLSIALLCAGVDAHAGSTTQNCNGVSGPHRNSDKPQSNAARRDRQREASPYWHDRNEPKPGRSPRWHCAVQDYNDPRCRDERRVE
jgi:hypothetical protein